MLARHMSSAPKIPLARVTISGRNSCSSAPTHGCGRFFNAVRDTVSDKFLTTYKAGAPRPDLSSLTEGLK